MKKSTLISTNNKRHNSDIIKDANLKVKVQPNSAVPKMNQLGTSPSPKKIDKVDRNPLKHGITMHEMDSFKTDSDFNVSSGTTTPPIITIEPPVPVVSNFNPDVPLGL